MREPIVPKATSRSPKPSLAKFLLLNLFLVLLFPLVCIITLLALWSNDQLGGAVLTIYSSAHLVLLWIGLARFGHVRRLSIPFALILLCLFGYNRHWPGEPDNSPFSDGAGTVASQAFGAFAYFRVYDQPHDIFGKTLFDGTGFGINIEFAVLLMVLLAWLSWSLPPHRRSCQGHHAVSLS